MSTLAIASPAFLDRSRSVAPLGFNRWLVPPAALAIHLAIGEVYAFSVFNIPLEQSIGITARAANDWTRIETSGVFSLAIVFLGLSAACFGTWLERVGPRMAMFASAACFGGGFLVSAVAVYLHQLWLLYLGYGVLGGIGLGLGYISPVSTLMKWFPDRPGMATGMAIMGFGGGALLGSPLSHVLMRHFGSAASTGVLETFIALGLLYFGFMMFGVLTVRLPPPGWVPPGAVHKVASGVASVTPNDALRTPSFWLLWAVLLLNVTAGIGVLGQASPMIQEMFPDRVSPEAAAGFVGLLSLCNMVGRFVWSSASDVIGRKRTYMIFFALGAVLYALTPLTGKLGAVGLFVLGYGVIMSLYGGGFATIPAYLRDRFGTAQVGAIHGRLLTAWSLAGIAGPVLITRLRDAQLQSGVPKAEAYTLTMHLMAGLLVIGFACNLLVRRAEPTPPAPNAAPAASASGGVPVTFDWPALVFRWAWVGVPLLWGVAQTALSSLALLQ